MIRFDLNEILMKKCLICNNFSTTGQNIMKPTPCPLLIEGLSNGTKVVTRGTMVWEISM
jgi:hypothetical protein